MAEQGDGAEVVVYREVLYFQVWFYLALVALLTLYAVILVPAITKKMTGTAVLSALVSIFLLLLVINFRRLEFVITENRVMFGFGVFKKSFPREGVTSCEPYVLTFRNYLGYGIRRGLDGTTAYNTRNGPGVKLTIEETPRAYVVSVDDPEKVCRILNEGEETRAT